MQSHKKCIPKYILRAHRGWFRSAFINVKSSSLSPDLSDYQSWINGGGRGGATHLPIPTHGLSYPRVAVPQAIFFSLLVLTLVIPVCGRKRSIRTNTPPLSLPLWALRCQATKCSSLLLFAMIMSGSIWWRERLFLDKLNLVKKFQIKQKRKENQIPHSFRRPL